MEVRQMRDAQSVKLLRQPGQHELPHAQANPARLEPPVCNEDRRERGEPSDPDQVGQI